MDRIAHEPHHAVGVQKLSDVVVLEDLEHRCKMEVAVLAAARKEALLKEPNDDDEDGRSVAHQERVTSNRNEAVLDE